MLYENSPIDLIDDIHFDKRELYNIDIHWQAPIPEGGGRYKRWVRLKPHVEYMIYLLGVFSTDELYKVQLAIEENRVPPFFAAIVAEFYKVKTKGGYLASITLTETPDWNYNDKIKLVVPKERHKQRSLVSVISAIHPRIPLATNKQIQSILKKE